LSAVLASGDGLTSGVSKHAFTANALESPVVMSEHEIATADMTAPPERLLARACLGPVCGRLSAIGATRLQPNGIPRGQ